MRILANETIVSKLKVLYWRLWGVKRFRVRYLDGRYSFRMRYQKARNYRLIFGGQIVADYNNPLKT